MTHSDPISDLLIRIKNAGNRSHASTRIPHFNFGEDILSVLKSEGWIVGFKTIGEKHPEKFLIVNLKYTISDSGDRIPLIQNLKRMSKPSRRVYLKKDEVKKVLNGLGTGLISTSQGLLPDREAQRRGLGGEYVAVIT